MAEAYWEDYGDRCDCNAGIAQQPIGQLCQRLTAFHRAHPLPMSRPALTAAQECKFSSLGMAGMVTPTSVETSLDNGHTSGWVCRGSGKAMK